MTMNGTDLGNALAAVTIASISPPSVVPFAPKPTPLPVGSPPTPEFTAQQMAYNSYQAYLGQLDAYNKTITDVANNWIAISIALISYMSANATLTVPGAGIKDHTGSACTGQSTTGSIS